MKLKLILSAALVAGVRYHHQPSAAPADMQTVAACVSLGNLLAHDQDQPLSADNADFIAALQLLKLGSGEIELWRRQLGDYGSMIAMMVQV